MKSLFSILIAGALVGALTICAFAEVPQMINYQGKLTKPDGVFPKDTTVSIEFKIYDDSIGGTILWQETQNSVQVKYSVFNVLLGSVNSIPDTVFDGNVKYLGVTVGGEGEMSPRRPIVSVAYAYRAGKADTGGISFWGVTDSVLYTDKYWGIARGGVANQLWGNRAFSHVNLGVACTTGTSGSNSDCATVSGGERNIAGTSWATVGGGMTNTASAGWATVAGGSYNTASGSEGTISGGSYNTASGQLAAVGGGSKNKARGKYSIVSGGGGSSPADSNSAGGDHSAICGGGGNLASGEYTSIGGGEDNIAGGYSATIGGGRSNIASGIDATVGGGNSNTATVGGTVAGGYENEANANWATVGGGQYNTASDYAATVAGGGNNTASGYKATVGGGELNTASNSRATIGGGGSNIASGSYSTVPGGYYNSASGDYSFAAGHQAKAQHTGCFVWADGYSADFSSSASHEFSVRASGGTRIYSSLDLTTGVRLSPGSSAWTSVSDSTLKRNIRPVDAREILTKLMKLPISQWSFKAQDPSVEHIGPMAQDFYALFGVGDDEKTISTIDPASIGLVATQELYKITQEQRAEIEELMAKIHELETLVHTILAQPQIRRTSATDKLEAK